MDINIQLKEFKAMRGRLAEIVDSAAEVIGTLDVENYANTLKKLSKKLDSDSFKIMVMGSFKNGKSTFINSLIAKDVLPAYVIPTTAIINEVKYGETPKAVLYFIDPIPQNHTEIPEKAFAHMQKSNMKNIPPLDIDINDIEDYLTIPLGMGVEEASKQSPYEKMELYWPLELLKNNVEIIDSPGLNESPVRTNVTMGYLANADAVIFVFNSLAFGSFEELEYIDTTLAQSGFNKKSIFCVVNRFDMLPTDKDRQKVQKLAEQMLADRTEHIFYTSAANALAGKLNGDDALLKSSAMPEVENALAEYLTKERGRIKLATPSQELLRIIRDDILNSVIPRRRKMLSMDLSSFKERYEAEKPNIEKLQHQRELILSKAEAYIANMQPDIRRVTINFINDLPALVKGWVGEYKPATKFSVVHPQKSAEEIVKEISEYLSQKLDAEIRRWTAETLTVLVTDKIEELKSSIEGRIGDFYVQLDNINFNITQTETPKTLDGIPVWQRIVAMGGGMFLTGPAGLVSGAVNGLNKDFAKSVGIQAAIQIVSIVLGIWNPVIALAVIGGSVIQAFAQQGSKTIETMKKKVCDSFCENINKESQSMSEKIINDAMGKIRSAKDYIGDSLNAEIEQMNTQLENMQSELEKGEDNINTLLGELDENEGKLRGIEKKLTGFVFELLQ